MGVCLSVHIHRRRDAARQPALSVGVCLHQRDVTSPLTYAAVRDYRPGSPDFFSSCGEGADLPAAETVSKGVSNAKVW